jgi:hypothetical protein
VRWRVKKGRGEILKNEKENVKGKRKKKENKTKIKKKREGYYGYFTLSPTFHN